MAGFSDVILDCGFVELLYSDSKFTWHHGKG